MKNEDGEPIWDIFCKAHIKQLSEPVAKKKQTTSKYMLQQIAAQAQAQAALIVKTEDIGNGSSGIVSQFPPLNEQRQQQQELPMSNTQQHYSNSGSSNVYRYKAPRKMNMQHALDYSKPWSQLLQQSLHVQPQASASAYTGVSGVISKSPSSSVSRKDSGPGVSSSSSSSQSSSSSTPPLPLQLFTVNEWPGQSDGEPLDLGHFWKVVSMSYPRDHIIPLDKGITDGTTDDTTDSRSRIQDWIEGMLTPINNLINSCNSPDLLTVPVLGTGGSRTGTSTSTSTSGNTGNSDNSVNKHTTDDIMYIDSLLNNIGTDQDRKLLLDEDKWNAVHALYKEYQQKLQSSQMPKDFMTSSQLEKNHDQVLPTSDSTADLHSLTISSPMPASVPVPIAIKSALPSEGDFYIKFKATNEQEQGQVREGSRVKKLLSKAKSIAAEPLEGKGGASITSAIISNTSAEGNLICDDTMNIVFDVDGQRYAAHYNIDFSMNIKKEEKGNGKGKDKSNEGNRTTAAEKGVIHLPPPLPLSLPLDDDADNFNNIKGNEKVMYIMNDASVTYNHSNSMN